MNNMTIVHSIIITISVNIHNLDVKSISVGFKTVQLSLEFASLGSGQEII